MLPNSLHQGQVIEKNLSNAYTHDCMLSFREDETRNLIMGLFMTTKEYKILLVEDDDNIRDILCEILKDEGYVVTPAVDGQEATEILQKKSFDLLISDFRMPRMNGAELLEWCRVHKLHFPVIFITANANLMPSENLALDDCCAALLPKPIDIEQLMGAINDAKKRHHNEHCK